MEKKREFKSSLEEPNQFAREEAPVTELVPEPSACINYEIDEIVPEPIPEPATKVVLRPNKPNFIGRKW